MKKRVRDPGRTRALILEAAFEEILFKGFNGVSIDGIVQKTKMTKGAFFHYFANKQELGYALIDEVLKEMILERWIRPLSAYKNPVQGILKRFKTLTVETPEDHMVVGCPLNNLIQEMAANDASFRQRLSQVLKLWMEETQKQLDVAKSRGFLKGNVDTKELAEFIVTVQEGTFGVVKATGERRMYQSLYRSLRSHLKQLSVPTK